MASDIVKATSLPFIPQTFWRRRALFFCKTLSQVEKVVIIGIKPSQGIILTVNKWVSNVNTFNSMIADFKDD